MTKTEREAVEVCKHAGLQVVEIVKGKRHVKIRCREGLIVCASSPSDHRWKKNLQALARRIADAA